MREEGLCAWLLGLLALLVVYGGISVRIKLFHGVLVNYKIAGRDNYVN